MNATEERSLILSNIATAMQPTSDLGKFQDPDWTASGAPRAVVTLTRLRTLWFNTGTLCNLACRNCYIESSPRNDRLVYLTAAEIGEYLDEIEHEDLGTEEIGFTGGEPFMNPELIPMLDNCLGRGFHVLVLTNAMKPMMKLRLSLLDLRDRYGQRLTLRVSLDHYRQSLHELERGPRTWQPALAGLQWLSDNGFTTHVAGRTCWDEPVDHLRRGYARLFTEHGIAVDAFDPATLILFPEMDARQDLPEITERCWATLGVPPDEMMCATSRMVIKRKGEAHPVVTPCTLLPYDRQFEMGRTLREAQAAVKLNHPNCARFCVLGGGTCSRV